MIRKIADNIISPLGFTTEANYQALLAGRSALQCYKGWRGINEPFAASLFTEEQTAALVTEGLTRFESLAMASVRRAVRSAGLDVSQPSVVLILSTTKANVELLEQGESSARLFPGVSAGRIARAVGVTTTPVTVCNACISGVSSIILASRLLDSCLYDYAIVCGAECVSPFILSGFQSLKAVSARDCRPFDLDRSGLNLGEAAATIVFAADRVSSGQGWGVKAGVIRNDAYHISAPSKQAEGACQALLSVLNGRDVSRLAFINAHGTATMFNDQMESVAIERAGLSAVPVNGLKGYYGHTLGAAGVLETLLSMRACDDQLVLGTRGFAERGVSGRISLSAIHRPCLQPDFVKMISGFGGGNAAIWMTKETGADEVCPPCRLALLHRVQVSAGGVLVDGQDVETAATGSELLTDVYRSRIGNYPKFYKMDMLSRLGFVASELLLDVEGGERFMERCDRAVILFNRSSSVHTDQLYFSSMHSAEGYFPSPSLFVYTLPNVVTGEIAIRNHYHGETSFYVLPSRHDQLMERVVCASLADSQTQSVVSGWLDYEDDGHFSADFILQQKVYE